MNDDVRKEIDYVMDRFDYDRVKKVMDHLFWLWYDTIGVPEIGDLREHSRRLLTEVAQQVIDNKEFVASSNRACGGFRAEAYKYADTDKIYLKLSFEVATMDNYD